MSRRNCWCGTQLRLDGTCIHRCDPELRPSLVRARDREARQRRAKEAIAERDVGTTKYMSVMSAAISKFDPVVRYNRERTLRAVRKSHGADSRRK